MNMRNPQITQITPIKKQGITVKGEPRYAFCLLPFVLRNLRNLWILGRQLLKSQ